MIKKLFHLCLLSFSLAASSASKKEIQKTKDSDQMENERFYYDVCCSAPRLNPGEYVSVRFIGDSGTLSPFGNNRVKGGMGCGMDGVARDRSMKYRLPKAIEATWVSYSDRKVYSVASLLPYDTILSLFNDGRNVQEYYHAHDQEIMRIQQMNVSLSFNRQRAGFSLTSGVTGENK